MAEHLLNKHILFTLKQACKTENVISLDIYLVVFLPLGLSVSEKAVRLCNILLEKTFLCDYRGIWVERANTVHNIQQISLF